jgi:hypothetical protein
MDDVLTAIEVNCSTGEVTERLLTQEEIAEREASSAAAIARRAKEEEEEIAKAAAKASALAKLTVLGLTAEEIAAL